MQISKAELAEYNRRVDAIADKSAAMAAAAYDEFRAKKPTASVAEVREGIIQILEAADSAYGGAVSAVAAQFMEEFAAVNGKKIDVILPEDSEVAARAIRNKAHYIVSKLAPDREDI